MTYVNSSVYLNDVFNNLNFPFLKPDSSYLYNDTVCQNAAESSDEDMMQQVVVCESKKDEGGFADGIKSFFKNLFGIEEEPVNTKDGVIGYTKQGGTGDCWLLGTVNSLSYTEKGREIIKDTLDYKDGYTVVHLKSVKDYVITDEELEKAKQTGKNSTGDDDMVILELAVEKVFEDIVNDKIIFDDIINDKVNFKNINSKLQKEYLLEKHSDGKRLISGSSKNVLLYLLTGRLGEEAWNKDDVEEQLNKFQNNKELAFSGGLNETTEAIDAYGKPVTLIAAHAYSIKDACDDTITVVNPWDSSKDIVLTKETFLNTFTDSTLCDLSDKNPAQNCAAIFEQECGNGNKVYNMSNSGTVPSDSYTFRKNTPDYTKVKIILSDDNMLEKQYFDENGNKVAEYKQKEGKDPIFNNSVEGETTYFYKNNFSIKEVHIKNGSSLFYLNKLDDEGNVIEDKFLNSNHLLDNIFDRNLLEYDFDAWEACDLAELNDENWESLSEILLKNCKALNCP